MKSGMLRGWVRRSRAKRLVYFSLGGGCWVGALASDPVVAGTADVNVSLTNPCNGMFSENAGGINPLHTQIPMSGVVGLSATMIARDTVAVGVSALYLMDYDDDKNPVGLAGGSITGRGYGLYFGKVINHYDGQNIPFIKTGGKGNTQFKYGLANVGTGSVQYFIRITGYWMEVDA